jgi:sugar phosphate isomerase/epimerase
MPQDILLQNTEQGTVDYEMDIYWVVTGEQDPEAWFRKYPNRFKLSHVKDRKKGKPASQREASVNLGTGSINFAAILKTAIANGMTHFFVEQELYEGTTPLGAVKANADYMKNFRFA